MSKKIKIIRPTETVWWNSTKEVEIQIDGETVYVRDERTQSYSNIYIATDTLPWTKLPEIEDEEFRKMIEIVAYGINEGWYEIKGKKLDFDKLKKDSKWNIQ